jgi:hypothetical protein
MMAAVTTSSQQICLCLIHRAEAHTYPCRCALSSAWDTNLHAKLLSLLLLAVGIDLGQDDVGKLRLERSGGLGVVGSELLAVSCVRAGQQVRGLAHRRLCSHVQVHRLEHQGEHAPGTSGRQKRCEEHIALVQSTTNSKARPSVQDGDNGGVMREERGEKPKFVHVRPVQRTSYTIYTAFRNGPSRGRDAHVKFGAEGEGDGRNPAGGAPFVGILCFGEITHRTTEHRTRQASWSSP